MRQLSFLQQQVQQQVQVLLVLQQQVQVLLVLQQQVQELLLLFCRKRTER